MKPYEDALIAGEARKHSEYMHREWVTLPDGLVEEVRAFPTYEEQETYQADLMYRLNRPPWNGMPLCRPQENPDVCKTFYSLAVYACTESFKELFIFDSHYRTCPSSYPKIFTAEQAYPGFAAGFRRWLILFAPANWNDFLMVRECYLDYVQSGGGPDWGTLSFSKNEQVDSFLRSSRGLILWRYQLDALLKEAGKSIGKTIKNNDLDAIVLGWEGYMNSGNAEAARLIKELSVAGVPLVDMVRERMLSTSPLMVGDLSLEDARLADLLLKLAGT